jgi:membrane protein implicated in regulation of membrane protease activity
VFLLVVALLGLVIGAAISFALSSGSTDLAFFLVVGVSILLAIAANSIRAAWDEDDKTRYNPRDVAAVMPVPDRFVRAKEKVAEPPSKSDPT